MKELMSNNIYNKLSKLMNNKIKYIIHNLRIIILKVNIYYNNSHNSKTYNKIYNVHKMIIFYYNHIWNIIQRNHFYHNNTNLSHHNKEYNLNLFHNIVNNLNLNQLKITFKIQIRLKNHRLIVLNFKIYNQYKHNNTFNHKI